MLPNYVKAAQKHIRHWKIDQPGTLAALPQIALTPFFIILSI